MDRIYLVEGMMTDLLDLARQRAAAAREAQVVLERAAAGVSEEARAFLRAPLAEVRARARDLIDLVQALQDGGCGHIDDVAWRLDQAGWRLGGRRAGQSECTLCGGETEIVTFRNGFETVAIRACAACGLAVCE